MIKIEYGKEHSDCTSDYIVTTNAPTVGHFINEWLTNRPGEWGYFGIKNEKSPFLGEPRCEYKYGKIISNPLSKSILSKKIKHVTGSGGYSRSDFQFEVEMDEISGETENKADINDYISRKSVLKTLDDMDKVLDTDRTVEEYKALLIECFKVLPSKDITEEFENVKKEIYQCIKHCPNETTDLDIATAIIDEHIAKLKGEQ